MYDAVICMCTGSSTVPESHRCDATTSPLPNCARTEHKKTEAGMQAQSSALALSKQPDAAEENSAYQLLPADPQICVPDRLPSLSDIALIKQDFSCTALRPLPNCHLIYGNLQFPRVTHICNAYYQVSGYHISLLSTKYLIFLIRF